MSSIKNRLLISIGFLAIVFLANSLYQTWSWTQDHITELIDQQNQLSLEFDKAIREYIGKVVRPAISKHTNENEFFPETMSTSFVARSIFAQVKTGIPHIVLKFSTENPRNPVNMATPEEIKIIDYFRQHPQETKWSGKLTIDGKQYYTKANARRMETECLKCHGRPEDAPLGLRERYGSTAGFGRSVGDVALDMVAVPVEAATAAVWPAMRGRGLYSLGMLFLFLAAIIYFILKDIEEKKKAEKEITQTKEFLENIFTTVIDGLIVTDAKGYILRINKTTEEITGYTQEELIGKHVVEFAALEQPYIDIASTMMTGLREKGFVANHETAWTRKDGSLVPVEFNITFLKDKSGHTTGAVGGIRDIAKRKLAEEKLRESEERYRITAETATDAIITITREGTIVFWNKAAELIFGYAEQEACGKSFAIIMPEKYQTGMRDWMEYLFTIDDINFPREPFEGFAVKKDGTEFLVEISLSFWKAGMDYFSTALIRDITSRKKTEQQIRETRDFLDNIFKTSADGIVIAGKKSIILMVNDAMEKILGYSRSELIGKALSEFVPPAEQSYKKGIEFISRLFEEGTVNCVEQQYQHKDGHIVDIELSAALLKDSSGDMTGSVGVFRDITERKKAQAERKKLEEQLQRSEKMETIGLLAGGVAHDLNNMLGAIVGYPELLLDTLPQDSSLRNPLKSIKDSGERAAAIVQDLLTLTRRGVNVKEIVNLNSIMHKYLESREWEKLKEFHPHISMQQQLAPELLNMVGSPVHLLKVIANLVSNAAEAISGAGTIQIITENRYLDAPLKGYDQIIEGEYVVLAVTDTGVGIAEVDQQRIFEPFYTKKIMGRSGTGLGMSVVWGTVKDHGGYIDLVSAQGKGTTITLYFPATSKELDEQPAVFSLESLKGSGQNILVIDDVETQRDIARAILTKLSYKVETVTSGEAAIKYLEYKSADLLVLDMIMDPGMDGLDTYRKILELHPGQKAIIASGYSETDRVRQAQTLGAGAYIKKPYTIEKLGLAVKKELDKII